jgi:hypothetical protein
MRSEAKHPAEECSERWFSCRRKSFVTLTAGILPATAVWDFELGAFRLVSDFDVRISNLAHDTTFTP